MQMDINVHSLTHVRCWFTTAEKKKKKKKTTKMPKIVEVGYIVAMPDTLQKDKHDTKPLLNQCWCISADYSYYSK